MILNNTHRLLSGGKEVGAGRRVVPLRAHRRRLLLTSTEEVHNEVEHDHLEENGAKQLPPRTPGCRGLALLSLSLMGPLNHHCTSIARHAAYGCQQIVMEPEPICSRSHAPNSHVFIYQPIRMRISNNNNNEIMIPK